MRKSYDLSNHEGPPNYVPDVPFPEGIVKFCKVHGYLREEETYQRQVDRYLQINCKLCARDRNIRVNFKGMNGMEDYQAMWDKQKGLCAICGEKSIRKSNNGKDVKSLAVDHCHITGRARELLCQDCNSGLGFFKDSSALLIKATNYLKEHEPT